MNASFCIRRSTRHRFSPLLPSAALSVTLPAFKLHGILVYFAG
jgi:hypothetical protein